MVDRRILEAYKAIAGAAIVDPGLVPRIRAWVAPCPSGPLTAIMDATVRMFDSGSEVTADIVQASMGGHTAADYVHELVAHAKGSDYPPHQLCEVSFEFLDAHARSVLKHQLQSRIAALVVTADETQEELERATKKLGALYEQKGGE
jgi:hypothetical protein